MKYVINKENRKERVSECVLFDTFIIWKILPHFLN